MPPARLPTLLAIGELIAPKAKLAAELETALEDPEDYVDTYGQELGERGIHEPVDHLPWVALVRGLVEAEAVATLDDPSDAPDRAAVVRQSIEPLDGCPRGAFAWMKHDAELAERSTEELLELTGKALLDRGAQLVQLDALAHRRWLVVIRQACAGELVKLDKAAGYRRLELVTGAGLIKATKDRARAARRATQTSARGADRSAKTRRYFARGKETWTISVTETEAGTKTPAKAGAMFETCYEKPRVLYYVHHHFDDAAAGRAGQKRLLAEWEAAGFREVDQATFQALPHAGTPYINWTAPFPDDANYVVEGKEIVRCTELRGDAVIQTAGTIGYNFGELQTVYHCKTEAAAARRYAQHVAADAHLPAISRAEVVKRYR